MNPSTRGIGIFAEHPPGLPPLFFTEMWERFSYYGMRAILMLYMVAPHSAGGLGFSIVDAGKIYGTYTMMVYVMSLPGGYIADKILGQKLSVLIGGSIIAVGHFTLAFQNMVAFYGGLLMIVVGTGMLKPNISTMVGALYPPGDHRRDGGFSIYYMGINIGATLAPLVCGYLAQGEEFKGFLAKLPLDPNSSWHFGFAAAGVGMLCGLISFYLQKDKLKDVGNRPLPAKNKATSPWQNSSSSGTGDNAIELANAGKEHEATDLRSAPHSETLETGATTVASSEEINVTQEKGLTAAETKRVGAICILFCFNILFWSIYEQGGTSLNLFADTLTDCQVFGWHFPSTWLQSFQAAFVIILAPVFSWLWIKLGDKEPSSPIKFSLGMLFLGLGIALMVPASMLAQHGKVSPCWLLFVYLLQVVGEMCLSPVGLSTVTKLAPVRFLSMTMGCWFLSNAIANWFAGSIGGSFNQHDSGAMITLFGGMGAAAILAAGLLVLIAPTVRKLMPGVR